MLPRQRSQFQAREFRGSCHGKHLVRAVIAGNASGIVVAYCNRYWDAQKLGDFGALPENDVSVLTHQETP